MLTAYQAHIRGPIGVTGRDSSRSLAGWSRTRRRPEEDIPLVSPEQDEFRRRAVRAVLVVAGIAAVFGLLVGGLTAGALYVSGVLPEDATRPVVIEDPNDGPGSIPSPSLLPTRSPTPAPRATASPASHPPRPSPTPSPTPSHSPKPRPTKSPKPDRSQPIELHASPGSAGTYEQVTLSGTYPGTDGTSLQVQRREGGSWVAFPTSATVDDGTFSTYVESGQSGPNEFRVVDPSTGRSSNIVVVDIS
jgi:hypothetical protein